MAKIKQYGRQWFAVLLLVCSPIISSGQTTLPTAGKHFIFSIPEDAANIGSLPTTGKIFLEVLSLYDGSGTLTAANGISIDFTFKPFAAHEIELPPSVMHGRNPGIAKIGIDVKTSVPVNLVLHDVLAYAGESTQLLPVESLGKDYVVASWGLFNDLKENNHAQVTITPEEDETAVTITPSVRTLNGIGKDSAVTILLGRGDSYILKADTSSATAAGLSGTKIHAGSRIAVITSVTCAYVPTGVQACNTLLDELLPLQYAGTEFYVSPLGDTLRDAYLTFTSATKNFTVEISDGRTPSTTTGHLVVKIDHPVRCATSAPAFCHLLTPGVDQVLVGDPSMVTILPTQFYQDTLLWYTPRLIDDGIPFFHALTLIHPASALASIVLDTKPLSTLGTTTTISGTDRSVTQVVLQPGVHFLTSDVPLFGIAYGLFSADAYAFLPMGTGPLPLKVASDEKPEDLMITVRPNPAAKQLLVDLAGISDSNLELTVYDALGKVVLSTKGTKEELHLLDIKALPTGSYLLEITGSGHRGRARFVISP